MLKIALGAALLAMVSQGEPAHSAPLRVPTRFGALTIGADRTLLFKGRPLNPKIQGNSGMDLGTPFRIGATDVVLLEDLGGTACPYQYILVTLSKSGAKATGSFGTCNVATRVRRSGDSILVTMHGYRGPFEPEIEKKKAARETHLFVFYDGGMSKDGNRLF